MSNINIQQVLTQMRALEAQAKIQSNAQVGADALNVDQTQGIKKTEFAQVLTDSINSVNDKMVSADKMLTSFQKGESNVSMAELMINMEKASVSFQAMTSVRNKLLTAYQEIMNMSV